MNPDNGRLYLSVDSARLDGVANPVYLEGRQEDIERISQAVRKTHDKEQKKSKRKEQAASRKANR